MKRVEPVIRPLVLYVEDEAMNWEVTELRLRPRFELLWARTDREACELVRQRGERLSAILMDIQLQGSALDGLALTQLFRGRPPAGPPLPEVPPVSCPIFFVTAYGTLHHPDVLRAAGGDGHVPKPVDFVKLTVLLNQAALRRAIEPR